MPCKSEKLEKYTLYTSAVVYTCFYIRLLSYVFSWINLSFNSFYCSLRLIDSRQQNIGRRQNNHSPPKPVRLPACHGSSVSELHGSVNETKLASSEVLSAGICPSQQVQAMTAHRTVKTEHFRYATYL